MRCVVCELFSGMKRYFDNFFLSILHKTKDHMFTMDLKVFHEFKYLEWI